MRILIVILAVLALAGCSAQQKSADTASSTAAPEATPAPAAGDASTPAIAASAPKVIDALTDQTLVYECPKCGMDFDAAGKCSMDGTELVATKVDYTCPADGKAVEKAGQCPRCAMHARVEKTAMAGGVAPGGN